MSNENEYCPWCGNLLSYEPQCPGWKVRCQKCRWRSKHFSNIKDAKKWAYNRVEAELPASDNNKSMEMVQQRLEL